MFFSYMCCSVRHLFNKYAVKTQMLLSITHSACKFNNN